MMHCPICSGEIIFAEDYMRDLKVFRCLQCGEMYAAPNRDVYTIGIDAVIGGRKTQ